MELQKLEINQTLNSRTLSIVANLNPCLAENESLLLSYYKRVRATWSNSAIKTVQKATGLKLTNKLNRCQFAIEAAKQELQFMQLENQPSNYYLEAEELPVTNYQINSDLPNITSPLVSACPYYPALTGRMGVPLLSGIEFQVGQEQFPQQGITAFQIEEFQQEKQQQLALQEQLQIAQEQLHKLSVQLKEKKEQLEQEKQQLEQSKNFSVLLLTNRLLVPGLPLNGTEESPAMRILGSPKTLTELEANYRELIKREHPDVSPFVEEEAINRFAYVRSLYRITREHWHSLKPTATITKAMLEKRMKATVPFNPESFWAA